MATVADCDVVSDGTTTLGAGASQDPDYDFALGFDQTINVGVRSVLSYMVDPGASGVTFKMSIQPRRHGDRAVDDPPGSERSCAPGSH